MVFVALGFGVLFATLFVALCFRRVVSTNFVHIVQSSKKTTSYGKDTQNGNVYYQWPSWLPVIGVTKIELPTTNFTLRLDNYEAYDQGRLPFMVDVAAFFRIADSNVAAQRISSIKELNEQLDLIIKGAVRTILASSNIETIMQGRSTFGEAFTREVSEQLSQWGVEAVKNMELMDIRDTQNSHVIRNIMEKKKSHIEMESRTEVAKNKRAAEIAEVEANREVDLQKQQALESVGLRTIEQQQKVKLSEQTALQNIKEQERVTKDKEMSILSVQELRKAEIAKAVQITNAEQQKQTTILVAEGDLECKRRESEAITLEGNAKAAAKTAMELAPVQAQIVLAKEIGGNKEYQQYLVTVRQIEAAQAVGTEQAKALSNADIKVISNTGTPSSGLNSVMDLFSSAGGQAVGSMLEGLSNTEAGKAVVEKVVGPVSESKKPISNGNGRHA